MGFQSSQVSRIRLFNRLDDFFRIPGIFYLDHPVKHIAANLWQWSKALLSVRQQLSGDGVTLGCLHLPAEVRIELTDLTLKLGMESSAVFCFGHAAFDCLQSFR